MKFNSDFKSLEYIQTINQYIKPLEKITIKHNLGYAPACKAEIINGFVEYSNGVPIEPFLISYQKKDSKTLMGDKLEVENLSEHPIYVKIYLFEKNNK